MGISRWFRGWVRVITTPYRVVTNPQAVWEDLKYVASAIADPVESVKSVIGDVTETAYDLKNVGTADYWKHGALSWVSPIIETFSEATTFLEKIGKYITNSNPDLKAMKEDASDWMSKLKDDVLITSLSIPGTHDSASYKASLIGGITEHIRCQDQEADITTQLEVGVRFLDIRINREWKCFHGVMYVYVSFSEVLEICKNFLTKNPKEVILMRIKTDDESGTLEKFNNGFKEYFQGANEKFWWKRGAKADLSPVSLGEARGKIIAFSQIGCGCTNHIYDYGFGYKWDGIIQDEYKNVTSAEKVLCVLDSIRFNNCIKDKWIFNFVSATGGVKSPQMVDSEVGSVIADGLNKEIPRTRVHVLIWDFVLSGGNKSKRTFARNFFEVAEEGYGTDSVRMFDLGGKEYVFAASYNKDFRIDTNGGGQSTPLHLWQDNSGSPHQHKNQRVTIENHTLGFYKVKASSGRYLDVKGNIHENGVEIISFDWNGGANQQWAIYKHKDGTYIIASRFSGKVLDVDGAKSSNRAKIQQWDYHGQPNQRFYLIPVTD
jgi:1-phosphatidylinositol phosphodiesterase